MGAFGMHGRPHPELPLVPARLRRAAACAEHMVYTWCTHGVHMVEPTPGQAACVLGGAGSQAWAARHGTGRRHFERAARTLYGVEAALGIEVDAVELQAARREADIGDAARQRLGDLRRRGAGLACVFAGLPAYPPA